MKNIRVGLVLISLASTLSHVEAQGLKDTVGKH